MTYEQFIYLFDILNADIQNKSEALKKTKNTLIGLEQDIDNSNKNILKLEEIQTRHIVKNEAIDKRRR